MTILLPGSIIIEIMKIFTVLEKKSQVIEKKMVNKNYKTISILFKTACLLLKLIYIHEPNFHMYEEFSKLYIDTSEFNNFWGRYEPTGIKECIVDMDFEHQFELHTCDLEKTNEIYYNQNGTKTKKPDAWDIDLLNQDQDNSYIFDPSENDKVELWILDTGINWNHAEFELGQVIDFDPTFTIANITHPHGTGTSIAAGGLNYGSSKKLKIYNFPVCRSGGGCGSVDIDKGFSAIINRLQNNKDENGNFLKRIVINLSVGISMGTDPINTSQGQYYNNIMKTITDKGGIVVTSAGNSNQDACTWFYSFSPYVISVGAIDQNYNKASFSNYGTCVDIWSFGVNVVTGYSTTDIYNVQYKSGTSFSSPLVAGLVANLLKQDLNLTRDEILQILYNKINNLNVPLYKCGDMIQKCCQGDVKGTRLDKYCRSLDLNNCARSCFIKDC